jgi:hypothetical protein
VVGRVCLDVLRSRRTRREDPLDVHLPDPVVNRLVGLDLDPEDELLRTESVGLALLVVLGTLSPAERLVFVLHDLFLVPFDQIAGIVGRSPAAAKQLASRARRRVRTAPTADGDRARERELVDAFLAAAREGNFEGLLTVLDPQVVLRIDTGSLPSRTPKLVHGAEAVARQALAFARLGQAERPVLVNGAIGIVNAPGGQVAAVMGMTVTNGRIVEIDILADRSRLHRLDSALLD